MIVLLALVSLFVTNEAKIPDYIHVCKRSEPNMNQCIINSVNNLRPKLVEGMPELGVPSIEPLYLPEIVVNIGGAFKAVGTNVMVYGCSNFEIVDLEADIDKLEYKVKLRFPKLHFDAIYDVDTRIILPLKGKGPLKANATDIEGVAIIKGHKVTDPKNKRTFVMFDKVEIKLKIKNYSVKLDNLFNGNEALGEAVNLALNENKREIMKLLRPRAESVVSQVLLDIANKITTNFDYNELFP